MKTTLQLIAEIVARTQVLRSLDALGAATEPWDELWGQLGGRGWKTSVEVEKYLREALDKDTRIDDYVLLPHAGCCGMATGSFDNIVCNECGKKLTDFV